MTVLSIIPWSDSTTLLKKDPGCDLRMLCKTIASSPPLLGPFAIKDWEALSDDSLFDNIAAKGSQCLDMTGRIFAVTDVSYLSADGVFVFEYEHRNLFFQEYFYRFGECFFNGDVLLIFPVCHHLAFFHHDGFFSFYPPSVAHSLN